MLPRDYFRSLHLFIVGGKISFSTVAPVKQSRLLKPFLTSPFHSIPLRHEEPRRRDQIMGFRRVPSLRKLIQTYFPSALAFFIALPSGRVSSRSFFVVFFVFLCKEENIKHPQNSVDATNQKRSVYDTCTWTAKPRSHVALGLKTRSSR